MKLFQPPLTDKLHQRLIDAGVSVTQLPSGIYRLQARGTDLMVTHLSVLDDQDKRSLGLLPTRLPGRWKGNR